MITLCNTLDCTGCGSCYNICPHNCIKMTPSDEGFLYPHINTDKCTECGLCQKKCPILNPIKYNPTPKVYASFSLDNNIRTTSSSGGLFSELSKWIIEQEGIVFGVVIDKNIDAIHTHAQTMNELQPMKGSKYLQSDTRETFKDVKNALEKNKYVLYSGTPCQIAGLLKYLSPQVYDKLFTVDLVCHGTPSSLVYKNYLNKLSQHYNNIDYLQDSERI